MSTHPDDPKFDHPFIKTTRGYQLRANLRVVRDVIDNDNEKTIATEYYLGPELVRRDVDMTLKRPIEIAPSVEGL